tara:strand:- start:3211 stop:4500 length:1290 start_codon:yes stop_codon:yes gene_type:complete
MFNIFKKKSVDLEKKSYMDGFREALSNLGDLPYTMAPNYNYNNRDMRRSMEYYKKISQYRSIVDKIATSCSHIDLQLKIDDKLLEKHPILDLINHPNTMISKQNFFKDLFTHYIVTGNIFIQFNSMQPSEMYLLPAYNFSINNSSKNSVIQAPKSYQYNHNGYSNSFKLDDDYIYQSNMEQVLLPILDFNPQMGEDYIGVPKTFSLESEFDQWISGNINNSSILERGGRIGAAWVNKGEPLTEEQFQRVVNESKKYDGSGNAAKTAIIDGDIEIRPISQTNADMQFQELRKENKIEIANALGYPLQLLLDSSMTYNNLSTAMVQYYDNAVLPVYKDVLSKLNKFFSNIYGVDVELFYNEYDIDPLRYRALEQTLMKSKIGINTINELRADISDEEISDGDTLLVPSTSTTLDHIDKEFEQLKGNYVAPE